MNPPLPEIFRCPLTGRDLAFSADAEECAAWTAFAARFALGSPVGALRTTDGAVAYPVWEAVVGLLPELARRDAAVAAGLDATKQAVARFYDEFGWVEGEEDGFFNDALAFEDLRPLTAFYRRRCHRRVNRVLGAGKYLLDVASGPVQIPEYVSFSAPFERRICVDLSVRGLLEAKRRLGDHALCVAGDITALPLRDGAVDAFVSLHTVYHVPLEQQSTAVAELHRVLRAGGRGAIVYSWGARALIYRLVARLARWLPRPPRAEGAVTPPELYFQPQDYAWYRREVAGRYRVKLRIWRSLEKESLEFLARGRLSAAFVLWPLYVLEEAFPRLFGRIGICPMFVLEKD